MLTIFRYMKPYPCTRLVTRWHLEQAVVVGALDSEVAEVLDMEKVYKPKDFVQCGTILKVLFGSFSLLRGLLKFLALTSPRCLLIV